MMCPSIKNIACTWLTLLLSGASVAMDLSEAIAMAIRTDAQYLSYQARARADVASADVAFARLMPLVTGTAAYAKNSTESATTGSSQSPRTSNYDSKSWNVSLRQPIYRPSDWDGWKKAELLARSSDALSTANEGLLRVRVANAYFQTLGNAELLSVSLKDVERYEQILAQAHSALVKGYGTRTDVEEAQAKADIAKANVIDWEGRLQSSERTLSLLVGTQVHVSDLRGIADISLPIRNIVEKPLLSWLATAWSENPELEALKLAAAAASKEIARQNSGHLPTVDLVVSRRMSSSDYETTIGQEYWTTSAGVQISVPIFAGTGIDAAVRSARASHDEALLRHEAKKREIEQELTELYAKMKFGFARWQALSQAVRSSEQSLKGTRKGLQAGTRNIVDLLNADQTLAEVEGQRIALGFQLISDSIHFLTKVSPDRQQFLRLLVAY